MIVLVDVNLSPRVVLRLRVAGLEAVRIGEILHVRATDEEVLAEAVRLGAVVASQDQDFSALLAISGALRPSLINVRVSDVDPERIGDLIATAATAFATDLEAGAILTIEDAGIRIHGLPVGV